MSVISATQIQTMRNLSDSIAAVTGAGPALAYVTAPTPTTEYVVLSDGLRHTGKDAVARRP